MVDDSHDEKKAVAEILYDSIVYVKVGPEAQVFGIHKGLLCHNSNYFKAALNEDFMEAKEGVWLKEDSPATFQLFNKWLYTNTIVPEMNSGVTVSSSDLVEACLFADVRGAPRLFNAALDVLVKRLDYGADLEVTDFRRIWDATTQTSTLRKLCIDFMYIYRLIHEDIMDEASYDLFTKEMLRDFLVAWDTKPWDDKDDKANKDDNWEDFLHDSRCQYHMHGPEAPVVPECKLVALGPRVPKNDTPPRPKGR